MQSTQPWETVALGTGGSHDFTWRARVLQIRHTENQKWPRLATLYGMHSWGRIQTREPPVPVACRHLVHTTSGHSQFAYLLIVALPPFPILPLGVKHSISDLCWASLLSLYLVSMNKDRSKQRNMIVCLTGQAEEELWLQRAAPYQMGSCFSLQWLTGDNLLDDCDGIWITQNGFVISW